MSILETLNSNEGLWGFTGLLVILIGWITGIFQKIWHYLQKKLYLLLPSRRLPKETLRIVIQPHSSFWSFGTRKIGKRRKKIIHMGCDLYLTNIARGDVLVTATYMKKPRSEASTPMVRATNSQYYGRYPIPPGATTEGRFSYFLDEVTLKKGQEFVGDIAIIDQLGNEHVVKKIKFQSRG